MGSSSAGLTRRRTTRVFAPLPSKADVLMAGTCQPDLHSSYSLFIVFAVLISFQFVVLYPGQRSENSLCTSGLVHGCLQTALKADTTLIIKGWEGV